MAVRDCCRRNPLAVARDETVRDVAKQMQAEDAGCAVIVDSRRRPVGMLTDRDIVLRVLRRGLDPSLAEVGEVMSDHPVTIRESTPISTAMRRMRAEDVRRLPVVDTEGALVGLFDWGDALLLVADELHQAAHVARAQARA